MAIDNDTSYELTGAQVKDLAQKIRNKADDNTFVGSSSSVAGSKGLVPAPSAGSQNSFLKGDGSWGIPERVVALYINASLESLATGQNVSFYHDPQLTIPIELGTIKSILTWSAIHLIYYDQNTGEQPYALLTCGEHVSGNTSFCELIAERSDGVKIKMTGPYNNSQAQVTTISGGGGATTFYLSSWSLGYLGAYSPLYTDAAATTTYSGSLSDLIQLTQSGPVYFHWVYQGDIYASAIMSFAYNSNAYPLYDIYAAGVVKPYDGQYSTVPDVVYGQVLNNGGMLYAALQTTPAGGSSITVVQTTGSSTTSVMSQKAVTTALNNKNALIIREWS